MRYLLTFAMCFYSFALIANDAPSTKRHHHRQGKRIKQGLKSGEITRGEAKRLRQSGKRIKKMRVKAKSDGEISRDERRKLHRARHKRDRQIYRTKHNDRKQKRIK